jgi:HNH endonuclease
MAVTDSEWKSWPGFSRYEASHRGLIRNQAGKILAARMDPDGYLRTTLTSDEGKRTPVLVHRAILEAHAGPCPPGMETCHGPAGKLDNRWPENLRWDTRSENERDKIRDGLPPSQPVPTFECLNFATCGNMVINEGRRCLPCVTEVGVEAAAMLDRQVNLMDVAEHFGYTGPDWVYQLAVKHGGCTLTKREALIQQPPLSRRVMATFRSRFRSSRA